MKSTGDYQKLQIDHLCIERTAGNLFFRIMPGVLCVFDKDMPSNTRHYHNCYELCIATEGKGIFVYREEQYTVERGDVFIADPGQVHEIRYDETAAEPELKVFHFSLAIWEGEKTVSQAEEEKIIRRFLAAHTNCKNMKGRLLLHLDFLREYVRYKTRSSFILETAIVQTVLDSLCALTDQGKENRRPAGGGGDRRESIRAAALSDHTGSSSILDEALLYIARHISGRITLEELAKGANTSKRNLQLLFREHLNETVTDYISIRKMNVAAGYLRMNFRVRDVAPKVGIQDPSQFCRLFKKYYHMTPKEYQAGCTSDGLLFAADTREAAGSKIDAGRRKND